jgi:uncharacterized protein (DUF849 family)
MDAETLKIILNLKEENMNLHQAIDIAINMLATRTISPLCHFKYCTGLLVGIVNLLDELQNPADKPTNRGENL